MGHGTISWYDDMQNILQIILKDNFEYIQTVILCRQNIMALILDHFDKPSPTGLLLQTQMSQFLLTFFVLSIAFSTVIFKSSKTDRTFPYSPKCREKYSKRRREPIPHINDLKNISSLNRNFINSEFSYGIINYLNIQN